MKKVLIIEDNDEVRENTAEILELSNYEVVTAENGKIGVEKALQEKPDLIICDIMMPVLDGYGVFHLLSKHKETSSIPFIFLTAKSEKSDFRKGMEMGADDYITKPFDGIELLNAIEVRLKKSEMLQQHFKDGLEGFTDFLNSAKETGKVQLTSEERDIRSFKKKFYIYKEGERPKALYYVVSGKVKISRTNNDGKELITGIVGEGDFFGYIPILEETNYKEDAQVLEDTQVMVIPKDDFVQLVTNDMTIARQFIKIITHNILDKEEDLLNLAYNSVRQKVAYGLIQLHEKYKENENDNPILKMSRENMAQAIGIATESLIRTLGDFKDEKLIDIQTGKIQVLNEKKLRNML
ncbi:response regulator [Aridibaculum aurantiacum]|uniref:response regulator n=1 Tax=Aridibaculum aurantiacum TaxID=2810307 RepID=UPI001A96B6F7|nr:response regulator [Aridibaculum aurantiacum]